MFIVELGCANRGCQNKVNDNRKKVLPSSINMSTRKTTGEPFMTGTLLTC